MHPTFKRHRDDSSEHKMQPPPKRTALHTSFTEREAARNNTFVSASAPAVVPAARQLPLRPSAWSPAIVPIVHQPVRPAFKHQREASLEEEIQPPHKRAQHSAESTNFKVIAASSRSPVLIDPFAGIPAAARRVPDEMHDIEECIARRKHGPVEKWVEHRYPFPPAQMCKVFGNSNCDSRESLAHLICQTCGGTYCVRCFEFGESTRSGARPGSILKAVVKELSARGHAAIPL